MLTIHNCRDSSEHYFAIAKAAVNVPEKGRADVTLTTTNNEQLIVRFMLHHNMDEVTAARMLAKAVSEDIHIEISSSPCRMIISNAHDGGEAQFIEIVGSGLNIQA